MSVAQPGWHELLFGVLLVAAVATVGLPPISGPRLAPQIALPAALAAGAGLFAFLAGGRRLEPMRGLRRGARPSRTATVLVLVRAAVEEVAWRGFLLGSLAALVRPLAALLVTAVAFSLAHANAHGRQRLVHVVTGTMFGAVYLTTGQLAAAAVAHASYNALVVLAVAGAGIRDAA